MSLVAFDYDDFKKINDELGHAAGDDALRACTSLIRNTAIRAGDLFGRAGGDEFVIVLVDTPLAVAVHVANEVRLCIETSDFNITASFGVCTSTASESADAFLKRADTLLYRAKQGGRNRVIAE